MELFNPYRQYYGALIPNLLCKYKGLEDGEKILWAKLVQIAGDKGFCYPSQEYLAQELCKGVRQIKRRVDQLENKGFILIQPPMRRGQNNTYRFIKHPVFKEDINDTRTTDTKSDASDRVTEMTSTGDRNDNQGVTDVTLKASDRVTDVAPSSNKVMFNANKAMDNKVIDNKIMFKKEPNGGADAPASRKKSVKRIKPSAENMAGEIEKLKQNYPLRYRDLIEKAIGQIALTRKDHAISEGIIEGFLADLEKYQLWQIGQGIRTYIRGGHAQKGKNEKYLLGIIRGQDKNEGEFAYTDVRLNGGIAPWSQTSLQPLSTEPPVEKIPERIDFRGNPIGWKSYRRCSQTGHYVDAHEWDVFVALKEKGLIIKGEFYNGGA